jgi:lipopolysaccharide transport system ATP-binding protein
MREAIDVDVSTRLLERKDRQGSGKVLFKTLEFVDALQGDILEVVRSGQAIRIRVQYEVIDKSSIGKTLKIGIGFWNSHKQFKFAVTSEAVGYDLRVSQLAETECLIPSWPLDEGRYFCNLYSEVNGIVADWIKDARHVNVEQGDFYGTGNLPGSRMGGVFVKYEWIR